MNFFSSFGLSCVIFLFLLLLTYLGTLEQVEHGLFETQRRYFESFYVIHMVADTIPVVLPGVGLLMALLLINLICGGLVRIRKGWNQAGIIITHSGIALLLGGGFVAYAYSDDGHMTLYENDRSNVFKSYHEWEVVLTKHDPAGEAREYVIPHHVFATLSPGARERLEHESWPFSVDLFGYQRNAMPQRKGPMFDVDVPVVDGVFLQAMDPVKENERNVAGLYATVYGTEGNSETFLLWGLQKDPARFQFGDTNWTADMRRKQWDLPFAIELTKFTRELHPRTRMASSFESDVIKIEDGTEQHINISMNRPLRHKGYTFYQASWGPENAAPGDPLFSSFAVVRNPADKIPLWACVVITAGMALHFSMKLRRHLRAEAKRPT